MAHTTEDAKLVWQKVKAASDSLGLKQEIVEGLRKLKEILANLKGNPNLKFTPIDGTATASADVVISDTANKALLVLVLKKKTGTTVGFGAISNHASAIQAAKTVLLGSGDRAAEQLFAVYPRGFNHATGMTYQSVTAYDGVTANAAADQCDGFALSIDAELS